VPAADHGVVVRTGIQFGRLRAPVQPVSGMTSCLPVISTSTRRYRDLLLFGIVIWGSQRSSLVGRLKACQARKASSPKIQGSSEQQRVLVQGLLTQPAGSVGVAEERAGSGEQLVDRLGTGGGAVHDHAPVGGQGLSACDHSAILGWTGGHVALMLVDSTVMITG
jgi:hypothetical protein